MAVKPFEPVKTPPIQSKLFGERTPRYYVGKGPKSPNHPSSGADPHFESLQYLNDAWDDACGRMVNTSLFVEKVLIDALIASDISRKVTRHDAWNSSHSNPAAFDGLGLM